MATPEEQLEDFKKYLLGKGEKYENLTKQEKMSWSEVYDKYKAIQSTSQASAGKTIASFHVICALMQLVVFCRWWTNTKLDC